MEEVERNGARIAIIDHGKIIETGTPEEIIAKAKKDNLEDAFIELTGRNIRAEASNFSKSTMRGFSRM
jgi:ABC-2 type transport system ATP-binding protein